MSQELPTEAAPPSPPAVPHVEEVCDRFERAWKDALKLGSPPPRIEDYLAASPDVGRVALLPELIQLDARYRRAAGEPAPAEAYRARFPALDPGRLHQVLARAGTAPVPVVTPEVGQESSGTSTLGSAPPWRLRCPHCHNPIRLADQHPEVVLCPACGSTFRVEDTQGTSTTSQMRQLGKFQLLERVGLGAFGAVWRARDTELDRLVALKIPHASLLSAPADLERFYREARAAAQLRHPGIVTVHEVATLDGLPAIVADFIEGLPLRELLRLRRLTFRESAELMAQVAEALDYAHSLGLVHRDVKPGNIMLEFPRPGSPGRAGEGRGPPGEAAASTCPRPLVMDFGLALREEAEITLTVDGQILGTPAYMSPEQAAGHGHRVDRRSDVYSLGVVLYELLTGELPFRGSKVMIVHQVLHEEPRPPRRINDKVPRDLETICLKAMAKEPARRYASAREVADDLRRWLGGEPIRARPVGLVERIVRWGRRRPAVAALTGGTVLSTVLGFALVTWQWVQAEGARQQASDKAAAEALATAAAKREKAQAERARGDADKARRETQRLYAGLALDRGLTFCEQGEVSQGWLWLARSLERVGSDAPNMKRVIRRNLTAWSREHGSLKALLPHPGISAVAFSPDGKTMVTAGADRMARLWDPATNKLRRPPLRHPQPVQSVAFSPDGKLLACAGDNGMVQVWEAAGGEALFSLKGHQGPVEAVAFRPDGQVLASGGAEGNVRLWQVATKRLICPPIKHPEGVSCLAFSPDGTLLLTGSPGGATRLWSAKGQKHSEPVSHQGGVCAVAFSPDGQTFVAGHKGFGANLRRVDTRRPVGKPLTHQSWVFSAAFSPDGRTVVTGSRDGTAQLWQTATGQRIGSPLQHHAVVRATAFSPDGRSVLTAGEDGMARLWELPLPASRGTLLQHRHKVHAVAFSPDGRTMLTGCEDGVARLWDARTESLLGETERSAHGINAVAFAPDSRSFATGTNDGKVQLWSTATRKPLGPPHALAGSIMAVAFSGDGKTLALGGGDFMKSGEARLVDPATGKDRVPPLRHRHRVHRVAFSPDGRFVLTTSEDATAQLWLAASGKPFGKPLPHQNAVYAAAFSPDGKTVLTGDFNGTAQLWSTATGKPLGPRLRHPAAVMAGAFSPDGKIIVTADHGDTAQLWDTATGRRIGPPLRHSNAVFAAAFSPDGQRVLTGSWDFTARLRKVPPPLSGEVERILLWARVSTNTELDREDVLRPLDARTWQEYQGRLRELGGAPVDFSGEAERVLAWHEQEAEEAEGAGDWFAAAWHLDRLIQAEPARGQLYFRRARAHNGLGRWDRVVADATRALELKFDSGPVWYVRGFAHSGLRRWPKAAADYAQAIARGEEGVGVRHQYALLLLATGDLEGYRRSCAGLLERFGEVTDEDDAEMVGITCSLGPGAVADFAPALRLLKRGAKNHPKWCKFFHPLGGVCYRAGQFETAIQHLRTAMKNHGEEGAVEDWLFLAMVHHRLGRGNEARHCLDKATRQMNQEAAREKPRASAGSSSSWVRPLKLELLRREAEDLLKAGKR